MRAVEQMIGKVRRKKLCKHANNTRHCGNPRCKFYIGRMHT